MNLKIKKTNIIIVSVLVVVLVSSLLVYKSHREKAYFKNACELKAAISTATTLSAVVTSQYSEIWGRAIHSSHVYIDGKEMYFRNFNEAVEYKMKRFEIGGMFKHIDQLSEYISQGMKNLKRTPSKYKDLQPVFIELYSDVNEFTSLTKSPQGSLTDFNQEILELASSINKNMKLLEITLPADDTSDRVNAIIDELISNLRKYDWDND
jgi:hypothetical protein